MRFFFCIERYEFCRFLRVLKQRFEETVFVVLKKVEVFRILEYVYEFSRVLCSCIFGVLNFVKLLRQVADVLQEKAVYKRNLQAVYEDEARELIRKRKEEAELKS